MTEQSNKNTQLTQLERALLALKKYKNKLDSLNEPIAIVGMECRVPGANNVAEFWDLLKDGRNPVQSIPKERWDIDKYYDPDLNTPGKMISDKGGFISGIDEFDAEFFNISPRECNYLDPQQRLLLEVTWLALENAGIPAHNLVGTNAGVFVGIGSDDYKNLAAKYLDPQQYNNYFNTGNSFSAAAGRLSYFFGLKGPCLAIDTACSSSMVAVNDACMRLRLKECDLAIAAGVNVILIPSISISLSKAGMLSPDGLCKTFDEKAKGYVRGEGCGVLILKRLSEAEKDNDNILAVIKASAINQDGTSSALTVPNGQAQEKLFNQVLSQAGIKSIDIDYVEVQGAGTNLGDSIEVRAIGNVYGKDRRQDRPLYLGAVKTNIGHLEAASGIMSVIKATLSLQKQEIPSNLHFENLNSNIDLSFPAQIINQHTQWKINSKPRYATVNSFGFSGTNANVLLQEFIKSEKHSENIQLPPLMLLVLSATSKESLEKRIEQLRQYLNHHPNTNLINLAYTLSVCRDHFEYRTAFIVKDVVQLKEAINNKNYEIKKINDSLQVAENASLSQLASNSLYDLLAAFKKGYLQGTPLEWRILYPPSTGFKKLNFPAYPFSKKKYWLPISMHNFTSAKGQGADDIGYQTSGNEVAILKEVAEIVRKTFSIQGELVKDLKFSKLGIDSITSFEMINEINKKFNNVLQKKILPIPEMSVADLGQYVLEALNSQKSDEAQSVVRIAGQEDEAEIRRLIYENCIESDITFNANIKCNYFNFIKPFGVTSNVLLSLDKDKVIGTFTYSQRPTFLSGKVTDAVHASYLFIDKKYQNTNTYQILSDTMFVNNNHPNTFFTARIESNNEKSVAFTKSKQLEMKNIYHGKHYIIKVAKSFDCRSQFVRRATSEDLLKIIDCNNALMKDFSLKLDLSMFSNGGMLSHLDRDKIYVYFKEDKIHGYLSVFDLSNRQTLVVNGYSGLFKWIYWICKKLNIHKLPAIGQEIKFAQVTLCHVENHEVLDDLLTAAYNDLAANPGVDYLIFSGEKSSEMKRALKKFTYFTDDFDIYAFSQSSVENFPKLKSIMVDEILFT